MKIIALASEKGGVGKTSVCINLAAEAAQTGASTVILDMDPQATTMRWGQLRGESANPETVWCAQVELPKLLKNLARSGVAYCFLDLPGSSSGPMSAGIHKAHFVLIPTRPNVIDLHGAIDAVNLCLSARKKYAFLLNIVMPPPGAKRTQDFAGQLKKLKHSVVPIEIMQRHVVADSMSEGLAVCEHRPTSPSAKEYRALFRWIDRKI